MSDAGPKQAQGTAEAMRLKYFAMYLLASLGMVRILQLHHEFRKKGPTRRMTCVRRGSSAAVSQIWLCVSALLLD